MNIEEYRAMVAQEKEQGQQTPESKGDVQDVQTNETPVTPAEQAVQAQSETEPIPNETTTEAIAPTAPQAIDVDGVEVPVEELRQGYLRQSDYTRKTQELSRIKSQMDVAGKYYEAIQSDPEFAESIARRFDLPFVTPEQARFEQLNHDYHTLLIERDIGILKSKYEDVDVQEVLQTAHQNNMQNLEDAYLLVQAKKPQNQTAPDIDGIKEQIRQEVLRELQSNVDTSTIIGTGGNNTQVKSDVPELSAMEARVAQNMGMTASEYAKWKNMK